MQTLRCLQDRVEGAAPSTPFWRTRAVLGFCILHLALLTATGCAKAFPQPPHAPPFDPIKQLATEIAADTQMPGVRRATWGLSCSRSRTTSDWSI
jgi:hypothetical protein